ncbi:MAG: N-acetylneuraminate synthase [Cytophagaceae bacterium]|nr:N-acetylneuraminate synthase [Cytophagaceae bacterium]
MTNKKHTIIIAEAGVNHNGDISLAMELVDQAAASGADYVKFQTFKAEKLVSVSAKKAEYQKANDKGSDNQFEMLKKLELTENDHEVIIKRCKEKGIGFLSSAFDLDSLDYLQTLDIPFFKVPSGELVNTPYLKKIAAFKKKIILSTGMATLEEISEAIKVLEQQKFPKSDLIVLHCNTQYPTPFEDVNLRAMITIKDAFGVEIGYSDHTEGIEVPIAATAMGAVLIEKHFTLDKNMPGPDHKASLAPAELKAMVKAIRNIDVALGDGIKKPSKSEKDNIVIVRKSIHVKKALEAGHVIKEEDICLKRPATGLPPSMYEDIIGKKLFRGKKADEPLFHDDIIN